MSQLEMLRSGWLEGLRGLLEPAGQWASEHQVFLCTMKQGHFAAFFLFANSKLVLLEPWSVCVRAWCEGAEYETTDC